MPVGLVDFESSRDTVTLLNLSCLEAAIDPADGPVWRRLENLDAAKILVIPVNFDGVADFEAVCRTWLTSPSTRGTTEFGSVLGSSPFSRIAVVMSATCDMSCRFRSPVVS